MRACIWCKVARYLAWLNMAERGDWLVTSRRLILIVGNLITVIHA